MIVDRVVSVHFPKAAGTSLRTQLTAHFPGQVAFDYAHDPLMENGGETAAFPAGARIVHGHFRPGRYADSDMFLLTFLRDPVENLISIYYFWLDLGEPGNPVHARFLAERPDIFAFARYPAFSTLMSQTYFGGFDMARFDFIGFHESRVADLISLGRMLGVPLRDDVHENPGTASVRRAEVQADSGAIDQIRGLLKEDVAFYDRVRNRLA